jgi:hypothetical protein
VKHLFAFGNHRADVQDLVLNCIQIIAFSDESHSISATSNQILQVTTCAVENNKFYSTQQMLLKTTKTTNVID